VLVHYEGWSTRWDEWLELSSPDGLAPSAGGASAASVAAKDDERVAALGRFTDGAQAGKRNPYALGDSVLVYHAAPMPRQWSRGVVTQIDGMQCSVRYEPSANPSAGSNGSAGGAYQRWFHSQSDEIEPDRSAYSARTAASAPSASSSAAFVDSFLVGGFAAL